MENHIYFLQLRAGLDFAKGNDFADTMANYSYIIGDRNSKDALIIDPSYAPLELLEIVKNNGFNLKGALVTHFHADHIGGVLYSGSSPEIAGIKELLDAEDIPIHIQRAEEEWVTKATGVGKDHLKLHDNGDIIKLGNTVLTLLHTPGHTPGSQCILLEGRVITGDTLFLRGCGRSDLPGGNPGDLYESLNMLAKSLPPATLVYAGHDYDEKKYLGLGDLIKSNPVMRDVSKEVWVGRFA